MLLHQSNYNRGTQNETGEQGKADSKDTFSATIRGTRNTANETCTDEHAVAALFLTAIAAINKYGHTHKDIGEYYKHHNDSNNPSLKRTAISIMTLLRSTTLVLYLTLVL